MNQTKKKSAYQKLKEKNSALQQDIFLILRKPDTIEGITAKTKWSLAFDAQDAVWFGNPTKTQQ